MTDETNSPATEAMPAPAAVVQPPVAVGGEPSFSPSPGAQPQAGTPAQASDRPEIIVAGAFAAGFVVAMIVKRLGH